MKRAMWVGAMTILVTMGCAGEETAADPQRFEGLDQAFFEILEKHDVATAGAGIIESGQLVWTGYFGDQMPGVPATSETIFNVGSVTKTVAADVIIRLVAGGEISLDEPMAPTWVDPDLTDDPRHLALTPRIALNHSTGFPNWRYQDPEFKLRFRSDPGTSYGYSGEGLEYVARFAAEKTGTGFEELVQEKVLVPLGLNSTAVSPRVWIKERVVLPVAEDGTRRTPFCTGGDARRCSQPGDWSAADDMATTVEDFAAFMIAVMNADGVTPGLQDERFTISMSTAQDPILRCSLPDKSQCPEAQGYGIGWEMFDFGDRLIASHGGADWSERAMVYFDVESRDGIILFLNAPSSKSTEALIDGMNALDPGSPLARLYRGWVDAYKAGSGGSE